MNKYILPILIMISLLAGLNSCSDEFGGLQILYNTAAEVDDEFKCEWTLPEEGAPERYFPNGTFDVALMTAVSSTFNFPGYRFRIVLKNQYSSNVVKGTERNLIEIDRINIVSTYTFNGRDLFSTEDVRYANITIFPEAYYELGFTALDYASFQTIMETYFEHMVEESRAAVRFEVTVTGKTVSGEEVVSNVFEYESVLCFGCLVSNGAYGSQTIKVINDNNGEPCTIGSGDDAKNGHYQLKGGCGQYNDYGFAFGCFEDEE